jgi:hypothetical protein
VNHSYPIHAALTLHYRPCCRDIPLMGSAPALLTLLPATLLGCILRF